jgi:hypothetical protein
MESVHEWLLAKGLGETVANIDSIEFECVEDFFELTMADVDDMAKEYGWKVRRKVYTNFLHKGPSKQIFCCSKHLSLT